VSLVRWEPFREMDNFFRRYVADFDRDLHKQSGSWAPIANISETDKEYLIKAELPEVKKEDIKVSAENGVITISGERKQEKEAKTENEIRVESFYGTFSRSFALPENVDEKLISAEAKDGVLRISIPKTAPSKPKQISIAVK